MASEATAGTGIYSASSKIIDYPAEAESVLTATVDGDGYRTLTWYVPENLRGKNDAAVPTIGDRTPSNVRDGMGTYIRIKGIVPETATEHEKNVAFTLLLGDLDGDAITATNNGGINLPAGSMGRSKCISYHEPY